MNLKLRLINISATTNKGAVCIYLDFYSKEERKQKKIGTSVRVEKSHWDSKKEIVKKSHPDHIELNELLRHEKQKIYDHINQLKREGVEVTSYSLDKIITKKAETKKDLISLLEDQIETRQDLSFSHKQQFKSLISRIKDFLGDNRVHYSQIDQKWIDSFSNYLKRGNSKSEERRFRQGLQPSTLHKKFSFFKQALYRLYNEGLIDDKFKFFKYPKKGFDKKKIVLTGGEIVKIVQYNPESEKLKKVKDLMLMQMMTGLRYSDVMNIRKSTITGDSIEIMNQKTKKITKIPLIESAKSILEKYDYNLNSIRLSNQKYNTYIKEFLRLAGINELVEVHSIEKGVMKTEVKEKYQVIASHSFRRTFITHAVVNNTPIHVIQSFTGHATLKELSGYVSIGEEVKMKEIKKLDSLFNSKQES